MRRLRTLWGYLSEPHIYWRLFSLALAVILWLLAAGEGDLGGTGARFPFLSPRATFQKIRLCWIPAGGAGKAAGAQPHSSFSGKRSAGRSGLGWRRGGQRQLQRGSARPSWRGGCEHHSAVGEHPDRAGANGSVCGACGAVGRLSAGPGSPGRPDPASVEVTAPRSVLAQVDQIAAYISVGEAQASFAAEVPLIAIDQAGGPVQNVSIDPPQVTLVVMPETTEEL